MDILDIHTLDEQAKNTLRFVQQFEQLREQTRDLYPGFDLIIARDTDQPELMPLATSKKESIPFPRMEGIQQIREVLKEGPLVKSILLHEIHRRGGHMKTDSLNTYLRRGKARGILSNFGDRIWGLKDSITNGTEVFNHSQAP